MAIFLNAVIIVCVVTGLLWFRSKSRLTGRSPAMARSASRPDYVPPWWYRYGANRWIAEDPRRQLTSFIVGTVVAVGIIVLGGAIHNTSMLVIGAFGTAFYVGIDVVYGPRAYRAMKRSGSGRAQ